MDITYCEKWWFSKKKPLKKMNSENAKRRHESRKPYVAVLGYSNKPLFIIDVSDEWVSIIFMDEYLRQYLRYDFRETQSGKLFLKTATYWLYEDDSDAEIFSKIFSFNESGHIIVEERNLKSNEVKAFEDTLNVDNNWEDYPFFGNYESLCKKER